MNMKVELIEEDQLADIVYLPVSTDEAKDIFGEEFDFMNECWTHYLYDDDDKIVTYYFHDINENEYYSRAGLIQENVTLKRGNDWTVQFVINTNCDINWKNF